MTNATGYGYFHGTACYWSETRSRIKHHHHRSRVNDRCQWGTSQSPSPLMPMARTEAESYEGFFDLSGDPYGSLNAYC
jgi:hypothetical protein